MNFYTQQHKHYCGIDLHAKAMYICILDQHSTKLVHKNLPSTPGAFLHTVVPYREDLVVAVECLFTRYWLADLCAKEGNAFVLEHALYMRAIHGGKAKSDRIDAHIRVPSYYVAECCSKPMSILRRCGRHATYCGGGIIWYASAPNS